MSMREARTKALKKEKKKKKHLAFAVLSLLDLICLHSGRLGVHLFLGAWSIRFSSTWLSGELLAYARAWVEGHSAVGGGGFGNS